MRIPTANSIGQKQSLLARADNGHSKWANSARPPSEAAGNHRGSAAQRLRTGLLASKPRRELPLDDQSMLPGVRATFISHDTIAK
jgi:hypothetical protein